MARKYNRYKKDLEYSYTLGTFLTIELLIYKSSEVQCVLIQSKAIDSNGVKKIIALCKEKSIPYEINDKLINILSSKGNCYVIGVFNKYEEHLNQEENHIVLVNPSDSGNLGTIIRSALGFDVKQIAIVRDAVDIYDPKTIRASMGSLFQVSFQYFTSFKDYQISYHQRDLYPFMLDAKLNLYDVSPHKHHPYSLIFGNEGSGLDHTFKDIGTSVIIPHENSIDSLNLSVAVGIALYEFSKIK